MSRVTGQFKLAGTKSFRRASSQLFGHFGINVQNPSKTMMEACEPDPGCVFLQADQSGAEARCVSMEADNGNYRQLFDVGIKPHTYLAFQIFLDKFRGDHPRERYAFKAPRELYELGDEWRAINTYITKDKSNEREYALGKLTAHGKSYDMGIQTFRINVLERSQGTIRLTFQEAKYYMEMFEVLFPEVIAWQRKIKDQIYATRRLVNLFGHPREFHGRMNDGLIREAYSWIPQSTIGIITSNAICAMSEYIEEFKLKWDILNDKHDSALAQCPIPEAHHCGAKLEEFLQADLMSTTGLPWKMGTELFIGVNWKDMVPFHSDKGVALLAKLQGK